MKGTLVSIISLKDGQSVPPAAHAIHYAYQENNVVFRLL